MVFQRFTACSLLGQHWKRNLIQLKRAKCEGCGKPLKVCLCPFFTQIDNHFHINILRHKDEKKHPLNTALILEKCLKNCTVINGETFSPEQITGNNYLLYPSDNAIPLDEINLNQETAVSFLILDGTWRKTNKIIALNPWLNSLPKISLPFKKSRYFLRKQKEQGFSTVETAYELLSQLENNYQKYQPLMTCLEQLMSQQASFIPPELFKTHYSQRIN